MSDKNTGGPAFPTPDNADEGMNLRDYFAAEAMHLYFQGPDANEVVGHPDAIAEWSYIMADSMLKARAR